MLICASVCRPRGAPPGGSSGPEHHLAAGDSSVHCSGACQQYITVQGRAHVHSLTHTHTNTHIFIYFPRFPGSGSGGQSSVSGSRPDGRLRSVFPLCVVCPSQRTGLCVERRSLQAHDRWVSITNNLSIRDNLRKRATKAKTDPNSV